MRVFVHVFTFLRVWYNMDRIEKRGFKPVRNSTWGMQYIILLDILSKPFTPVIRVTAILRIAARNSDRFSMLSCTYPSHSFCIPQEKWRCHRRPRSRAKGGGAGDEAPPVRISPSIVVGIYTRPPPVHRGLEEISSLGIVVVVVVVVNRRR